VDSVDLSAIVEPDLGIVDLLARATLEARRWSRPLRWTGAAAELRALIALCGLDEYLRLEDELGIDPGG
jgi:hypothetical protein